MYSKAIPKPLQLTPRKLLKHSKNTQSYDAKGSRSAASSLQNTDVFAETDSRLTWEVLTDSPPSTAGFSPLCQDLVIPSPPKSSAKIKRWLRRRRTTDTSQDSAASTVEITTPITAPADLDPGFSPRHYRPVPNLKIELPQLSLEELAKVDAFYAPTPVLPETPAPRTGKVYPPWSPDIDYRFKPERSASMRFRSIKTADVERGILRAESLKRLCAVDVNWSDRSERHQDLSDQIPMSSRSEITHLRDSNMRSMSNIISTESWRHQWVYSKDGDGAYPNIENIEKEVEMEDDAEERTLAFDTEQEWDASGGSEPAGGRLFFIMGDSPADSGEVTLRFVKDHLERSLSSTEIDVPSSRPSSPVDFL